MIAVYPVMLSWLLTDNWCIEDSVRLFAYLCAFAYLLFLQVLGYGTEFVCNGMSVVPFGFTHLTEILES